MIVVRLLEETNVLGYSWVEKRATYRDTENPVDTTYKVLKDVGAEKKTVGFEKECWFLTTAAYEQLCSKFPDASIRDCSGAVEELRLIKSEREIEYIRKAGKAAEKATKAGLESCAPGRTENEVAAEIFRALLMEGSEYMGLYPFITSGPRSALGHATWQNRQLQKGDAVFIEIGACVRRYHAALMRTAVIGDPSDKMKKVAQAVADGLAAAVASMKPGATAGEVDDACRGTISRAGFGQYFHHRTGYSIGIAFPPDWGEGDILSLKGGERTVLKPNMVFHTPPACLIPGEFGIGMSATTRITENGNEQ
jgi:Xaa-Pro dipeptidase